VVGRLIIYGFIIGIAAGLLGFGWARVFGEPSVETAIAFESAEHEAKETAAVAAGKQPEAEDPELFSRSVQSGIGLLTGIVVVGAGLGCLFAILFAFANGRLGNLGPGATSMLLALAGLIAVYLVPALKYPANPPSIGEPDTIKLRTGLYFLMMAVSIASMLGASILRRRLVSRYGSWNGSLFAVVAYLVVIGAFFLVLPGVNEVPASFPAVTLWNFRMASLGIQTVLWVSIGAMFGSLAEWTLKPAALPAR
jgi:hypothetical protein